MPWCHCDCLFCPSVALSVCSRLRGWVFRRRSECNEYSPFEYSIDRFEHLSGWVRPCLCFRSGYFSFCAWFCPCSLLMPHDLALIDSSLSRARPRGPGMIYSCSAQFIDSSSCLFSPLFPCLSLPPLGGVLLRTIKACSTIIPGNSYEPLHR